MNDQTSFEIKLKFLTERLDAIQQGVGEMRKLKDEAVSVQSLFKGGLAWAGADALVRSVLDVQKVIGELKSTIDLGGQLTDLSARTGQTISDLVLLRQAFQNAGIEAGSTGQMLNLLQKSLTGLNEEGQPTSQAFNRLGLSVDSLKDMSAPEQIRTLTAALTQIQDPADRTRVAMELFGKSGGQMLAVLSDSSALDVAKSQVGSLGETMEKNAASFDSLGDSLDAIGLRATQLFAGVAEEIAPALQHLADSINEIDLTQAGREIGALINGLTTLAQVAAPAAIWLGSKFVFEKTVAGLAAFTAGTTASTAALARETGALEVNTAAKLKNAAASAAAGAAAASTVASHAVGGLAALPASQTAAAAASGVLPAAAAPAARAARPAAQAFAAGAASGDAWAASQKAAQSASIINANAALARLAAEAKNTSGSLSKLSGAVGAIGGNVGVLGATVLYGFAEQIKAAQDQDIANMAERQNKDSASLHGLKERSYNVSGSEDQAKLLADIREAMVTQDKSSLPLLRQMYDRVAAIDGKQLDAAAAAAAEADRRAKADEARAGIKSQLDEGLIAEENRKRFDALNDPDKLRQIDAKIAAKKQVVEATENFTPEQQQAAAEKILDLTRQRNEIADKITEDEKAAEDKREALELELKLNEATSAGNKEEIARLKWIKEYNAAKKAAIAAGYDSKEKFGEWSPNPNDLRQDGTQKGSGFLGPLKRPDGGVSTEITVGTDFGRGEMEIPLLVPTLDKDQIDHLLKTPTDKLGAAGDPMFEPILAKAIEHAEKRLSAGKSVFAQPGESAFTDSETIARRAADADAEKERKENQKDTLKDQLDLEKAKGETVIAQAEAAGKTKVEIDRLHEENLKKQLQIEQQIANLNGEGKQQAALADEARAQAAATTAKDIAEAAKQKKEEEKSRLEQLATGPGEQGGRVDARTGASRKYGLGNVARNADGSIRSATKDGKELSPEDLALINQTEAPRSALQKPFATPPAVTPAAVPSATPAAGPATAEKANTAAAAIDAAASKLASSSEALTAAGEKMAALTESADALAAGLSTVADALDGKFKEMQASIDAIKRSAA